MERIWWKEAVIYQVYPRSFYDSNGDGIGDIAGIISKLDYLYELGIGAIWLSPIYPSPGDDGGYDVRDYFGVAQEFGTIDELLRLIREMHRRGMKLIMDLVVNHTSDEHPWFLESRKSRESEFRDYYIWRDGDVDFPPNNWRSIFSGSAWQYDKTAGQYYLHLFSQKQPDLNWENPIVRKSVADIANFWIKNGVDGFRLDAINMIGKSPAFSNAPVIADSLWQDGGEFYYNQPQTHEYLKELYSKVFSPAGCAVLGEASDTTPEQARLYTAPARGEMDMLINFEHVLIDCGETKWEKRQFTPLEFKAIFSRWQNGLNGHGWNCNYLTSHDQPRAVSRFGDDKNFRYESACMLATLTHTLQGTPIIYQGEELGMTNCQMESFEQFRDVEIRNHIREQKTHADFSPETQLRRINEIGRDNARTPMQWNLNKNAGFTIDTPWISVNPNYTVINAEEEIKNPHSVLAYHKKLIKVRAENDVLIYGDFCELFAEHPQIYCYKRTLGARKAFIILNLTKDRVLLPERPPVGLVVLSNYCGAPISQTKVVQPFEAQVILVQ